MVWEDRISNLPDEILIKILSDVPTKYSVRTSVLSKRWKSVWSHVPSLDVDHRDFLEDGEFDVEAYTGFITRFLGSKKDLDLDRFKLIYQVYEHDSSMFKSWIDAAMKRGVRDLTVKSDVDDSETYEVVMMPRSIYSCDKLVNLSLYCLHLDDARTSFSLPSLETMHLETINYAGDLTLGTLISSCESLRELTVIRAQDDLLENINVRSESLKRLILKYSVCERLYSIQTLEIDAPRLEYLSLQDHMSDRIIISNIAPNAKVRIDVNFGVEYEYESLDTDDASVTTMISNFLTAISNVRDMIISTATLEVMYDYCSIGTLPQFANLRRLHTSFFESSLKFLPTLLHSCPNLQILVVKFHQRSKVTEMEPIKFVKETQPFQSSLELVQMVTPLALTDTWSKLDLTTYFLLNCAALKKLKLSASFRPVLAKIRKIPRTAVKCRIVIG